MRAGARERAAGRAKAAAAVGASPRAGASAGAARGPRRGASRLAGAAALLAVGWIASLVVAAPPAGAAGQFTITFTVDGAGTPTTSLTAGDTGTVTITPTVAFLGTLDVTTTDGATGGTPRSLGQVTFGVGDTNKSLTGVRLTQAGTQTITATSSPLGVVSGSADFTVTAGPPARLAVSFGLGSVPAGVAAVAVTAQDSFGNTAPTFRDKVHLASSDPRAVLPADYAFTAGDAGAHTFAATLPTAGTVTVTASDVTPAAAVAAGGASVTVVPGPVRRLALSGTPSPLAIGTPADVVVTATDQFGNVIAGYTGTVHFTASIASSRVPADYTFVAGDGGTHRFAGALMFGTPGTVTVTATDSAQPAVTGSEAITLVAPATGGGAGGGGGGGAAGYSLVGADGSVYHFATPDLGSMAGRPLNAPVIGMAMTPTGGGYWLVAKDGGIFSFGDATFLGSMGDRHLNQPVLGMETTPTGQGYWLFAADGGIFSFGDATFHGSTGDLRLNSPVSGMAARADGLGYWLIAADGGVFAFDAPFLGSMGGQPLNQPMLDMAATPDSGGYWLVAKDGGVFTFGTAGWFGSAVGRAVAAAVGIAATADGAGYWVADARGEVFAFGDAASLGDLRFRSLPAPIVGFAALRPAP